MFAFVTVLYVGRDIVHQQVGICKLKRHWTQLCWLCTIKIKEFTGAEHFSKEKTLLSGRTRWPNGLSIYSATETHNNKATICIRENEIDLELKSS